VAETTPDVTVGDLIEIEAHQVGGAHRTGEIIELLGEREHRHFRVRWEDGTETIFFPSSDAHMIHPQEATKKARPRSPRV
jgi:uncharacterized protein DUF1918